MISEQTDEKPDVAATKKTPKLAPYSHEASKIDFHFEHRGIENYAGEITMRNLPEFQRLPKELPLPTPGAIF